MALTERLLITTALEETWGNKGEQVYFLGEWCKHYNRKEAWSKLDARTQAHHWNDRVKLKKDHDCLKDLYERTIVDISRSLNEFHNLDKPDLYWRIIVGPWLFSYIPVLFDRWEVIRLANINLKEIKTYQIANFEMQLIPFDYSSFSINLEPRDLWNHMIFLRILSNYYAEKLKIVDLKYDKSQYLKNPTTNTQKKSLKNKLASILDKIAFILSGKNQKIMFLNSYFSLTRLSMLNLKLKSMPRLYLDTFTFEKPSVDIAKEFRQQKILKETKSSFEEFLSQSILKDIPFVHLEAFPYLLSQAKKIKENPSIVLTAISHWNDEVFKVWIAEKAPRKTRLFITDHGSTFPALFDFFDHDESICEKKITWFRKTHPKHICLPPSKINLINIKSEKKYCSVIGMDFHRYVPRVTAFAHVEQNIVCLENTITFCRALDPIVFASTKVRPKPDSFHLGWDTEKRYADALGKEKIFQNQSYYSVLKKSKLIVCTYADTTYSEALATGLPAILVHRPEFFEKIPEAKDLIQRMENANMIFSDPLKAALHVNSVWDHIDDWWNEKQVVEVREFFFENALHIHDNWYKEWATFLKSELKKSN